MDTIESRVRRGATLLDATVPGWWQRINVKRLAIHICDECVLGQLFDMYQYGRMAMDLSELEAAEQGFQHPPELDTDELVINRPSEYESLRLAWVAEIEARLNVSAETPSEPLALAGV